MRNKISGFFIRFVSLAIDLIIFFSLGISLSLICIGKTSDDFFGTFYQVKIEWAFYLWLILLMIILITQFILIPFWFKGKTIGMILTKLKLVSLDEESIKQKVLKKAQISVFVWILIIILFMAFVRIEVINKINYYSIVQKNRDIFEKQNILDKNIIIRKYKLNTLETTFITIPSTLSSITVVAQLFTLLSIGISKNKIGILDKISNTKVVYSNKLINIKEQEMRLIKPEKYKEQIINWRN